MEDVDLVHKPGQHPLLPAPKELNVRARRANAQAAQILKQMMADAPVAEDQVLDISAGVEVSPTEEADRLSRSSPCSPAKQSSVPSIAEQPEENRPVAEQLKPALPSVSHNRTATDSSPLPRPRLLVPRPQSSRGKTLSRTDATCLFPSPAMDTPRKLTWAPEFPLSLLSTQPAYGTACCMHASPSISLP